MSLFEDLKSSHSRAGRTISVSPTLHLRMHSSLRRVGSKSPITRAVSVGIALLNPLVDLLPDREDFAAAMLYRHNSYDVVNLTLDQIALAAANTLQRAGSGHFPCRPQNGPATKRIAGAVSHKLAAHLTGIGWIGERLSPRHP